MRLIHLFLILCLSLGLAVSVCAADDSLAENPPAPHIALLLPLVDPALKTPAQAVRDGFLVAAARESMPVRVYATGGEPATVLATYAEAVRAGARVVVGPLARNAVTALARSGLVEVPTLTLSLPERDALPLPPLLVAFGLSVEEEARQVAELAFADGRRHALVVFADSALSRRMLTAFSERWSALGGHLAPPLRLTPGREGATKVKPAHEADMIFLAAGAPEARVVRPYLPGVLPVYATSQAFGGRLSDPRNVDLTGVRFVDMPWLLQPDHLAVMAYPRPQPPLSAELERLYALGIDAARLATVSWREGLRPGFVLDGVSGELSVGEEGIIHRRAVAAEFVQDTAVVIEAAGKFTP